MKGLTALVIVACLLNGCKHPGDTFSFLEDHSKVMTDEQRMGLQKTGQQFAVDRQVVYGYVPPQGTASTASYTASAGQQGGVNSLNAGGTDPNAASAQMNGYNGAAGTNGAGGFSSEPNAAAPPQTDGTYTAPQVPGSQSTYPSTTSSNAKGYSQTGAQRNGVTSGTDASPKQTDGLGSSQSLYGTNGTAADANESYKSANGYGNTYQSSGSLSGIGADPNTTGTSQTNGMPGYANGTNDPNSVGLTDPNTTPSRDIYGYAPPEDPNAANGANGTEPNSTMSVPGRTSPISTEGVRDDRFELVYNDLMQVMDMEEIGRR